MILMAAHQTDASIIKAIMEEPWINNCKTFKVDEELNLLQKKLHRPMEELKDTYHSVLCKK